jgi:hypothetical protein
MRRFSERFFRRTNEFSKAWVQGCVETGREAFLEHGADLIYASMSPFETAEAAERLSERLAIPWVADLRDPWALDEVSVLPTRWHLAAETRRMRERLSGASRIIMNTLEAKRALCETFPEFSDGRATVITNGFDASDFRGEAPERQNNFFRIVHTGHLHLAQGLKHRWTRWPRRLLGGERVWVDVSTRSHVNLMRALSRWRQEEPAIEERLEVILAGPTTMADRRVVEEFGLSSIVRMVGYLDHAASIALLRSANLLFLPMQKLPSAQRSRIVPGKTYEYLASKRPILAAVPAGDAADLVAASGRGSLVAPDDVAGILSALKERYRRYLAGSERSVSNDSHLQRFERRELTSQLSQVFHAAIGEAAPRSGSSPKEILPRTNSD